MPARHWALKSALSTSLSILKPRISQGSYNYKLRIFGILNTFSLNFLQWLMKVIDQYDTAIPQEEWEQRNVTGFLQEFGALKKAKRCVDVGVCGCVWVCVCACVGVCACVCILNEMFNHFRVNIGESTKSLQEIKNQIEILQNQVKKCNSEMIEKCQLFFKVSKKI